MECKDKKIINTIYILNAEDVKVKDEVVSIKRKYKEKKRTIYKII